MYQPVGLRRIDRVDGRAIGRIAEGIPAERKMLIAGRVGNTPQNTWCPIGCGQISDRRGIVSPSLEKPSPASSQTLSVNSAYVGRRSRCS